jgi:transporter family protein
LLKCEVATSHKVLSSFTNVFAYGDQKHLKELTRNNILFLVLSGLATGLSWIFYFKAMETGEVSKVAPIDKLSVAIAIVLSVLILGEPVDWKTILGALMIVAGTVILVL